MTTPIQISYCKKQSAESFNTSGACHKRHEFPVTLTELAFFGLTEANFKLNIIRYKFKTYTPLH